MPDREAVTVEIAGVVRLPATENALGRYAVLLEEASGARNLCIYIGEHEAIALAFALERPELPRPLTHQFTASLLEAASARTRSVTVTELVERTFYASVALEVNGEAVEVDARPSDGLVLAVLTGAEIRVAEQVLRDTAAAEPAAEDVEAEAIARAPEIVSERLATMDQAMRSAE